MNSNPFISFILDGDLKKPLELSEWDDPTKPSSFLDLSQIIVIIPDGSLLDFLYEDLGVKNFSELSSIKGVREALIYSTVFIFSKIYNKYVSLAFLADIQNDYPKFDSLDFDIVDEINVLRTEDFEENLPKYLQKGSYNTKVLVHIVYIEGLLLTDEASVIIRKKFILPFENMPKIKNPQYIGLPSYALASAEFLRRLHKEDCISIPEYWDVKDESFDDLGVRVIIQERSKKYIVNLTGKAENSIFDCLKSDKNFSIIYLSISFLDNERKEVMAHVNMLIYNKTRREIERFEPYGHTTPFYDAIVFDDTLKKYFRTGEFKKYIDRYVSPRELCPTMPVLFQAMDRKQKRELGISGYGWCQTWSIWYAHLRLSNKKLSQDIIIRRAMAELTEIPFGFIELARSYQTFFERFADWKHDQRDDKLFEQMLKEYQTK